MKGVSLSAMDDFLLHIFSPKDFSPQELETIEEAFSKVTFQKGDFLQKIDATPNCYWFAAQGYIRSYIYDTDGNAITTNFYTQGDIVIDWTSFFLRTPSQEYYQALTEVVAFETDYDTFQSLFHSIEGFREGGRQRLVASYLGLKQHSLSLISDTAKERYLKLLHQKPDIFQQVPLKQIASYLGITDTSLSRIRKELADTAT